MLKTIHTQIKHVWFILLFENFLIVMHKELKQILAMYILEYSFLKFYFLNHKRVLHSSSHQLFKETPRVYQSID